MSSMASEITVASIVYSSVCLGADKKTTSKPRVTDLYEGNSPVTGDFPAQGASNVEDVSIEWRHHVKHDEPSHIWRTNMLTMTNQPTSGTGSLVLLFDMPTYVSMVTNNLIPDTYHTVC